MRRLAALTGLALLLCGAAYVGAYLSGAGASRQLKADKAPELAWLKKEFHLTDAEYSRVCELHSAYGPRCDEMCRRIDAKNAEIRAALAAADSVTPEIEKKLEESAALRAECQKAMLSHFFEVSRSMPAEQGKRYLAWVQQMTFQTKEDMSRPDHHDHGGN